MILISISILTALSIGFLLTIKLLSSKYPLSLKISVSIGIGFGITSISTFLWINLERTNFSVLTDILLLFGLFILCNRENFLFRAVKKIEVHAYMLLLLIFFTIFLINFLYISSKAPHGEWDSWAFWNSKARYLYLGGPEWAKIFSNGAYSANPDYPLLIPSLVARLFSYSKIISTTAPISAAFVFAIGIVAIIPSSLAFLRSTTLAYFSAMVILTLPYFVLTSASQYADIPFSYFVCSSLIFLFLACKENRIGLILISGFLTGCSAWTKNEGILLFISVLISILCFKKQKWMALCYFLAGAAPVVLILFYFKFAIAADNPMIFGQNFTNFFAKISDISRYGKVLFLIVYVFLTHTKMLLVLLSGLFVFLIRNGMEIRANEREPFFMMLMSLSLMLMGYFLVYIISPYDLWWHIPTSLARLSLQVLPSLVFLIFILLKSENPKKSIVMVEGYK